MIQTVWVLNNIPDHDLVAWFMQIRQLGQGKTARPINIF